MTTERGAAGGSGASAEATLECARHRDATDPLRHFAARFALPRDARGAPLTYLCGHSLGPMPLAAREVVLEELDDWARLAVLGHETARRPWLHYHEHLRTGLEYLTGARPGEVVAMSSLTINLHLMLASFYRPSGRRTKILIESGVFPSDRHAVASQIAWHGLDPRTELIELAPAAGEELLREAELEHVLSTRGDEIATVLWPAVQYRTAQAFDLAAVARAARRAGCIVGFDLAHAIGNVPLALHACDADFAVWCSYKYLNGGPGAVGGCFVHERHGAGERLPRLAGWWGHDPVTRFDMRPEFRAAPGAAGWQVSNPPILSSAPLIASLAIFREAGIERLREKSVALGRFLEQLLAPLGVTSITPSDPRARGAQLSIRVAGSPGAPRTTGHSAETRSRRILESLAKSGVICDLRPPDLIRVAPAPLYNGFQDVFHFAERLREALGTHP
ncbi:MAG TPA: kynureninase [Steroidobacteraceae bacterium]|nr:kynureninase [Steroidobacteraceae bacterium]